LVSLVDHSLKLTKKEERMYHKLIQKDLQYKEAQMLQSIEQLGIEKGVKIGIKKGLITDAREMVVCAMQTKYNNDSQVICNIIQDIKDRDILRNLLKEVILCEDFVHFKHKFDNMYKS